MEHPEMQNNSLRTQLLSAMEHGEYASCTRLPPESILAEKMGISRTQLRDVLASLEREGFITRRHGVGTLINRHVLNVRNRMDIEVEFLEMIRRNGFTPAVAYRKVAEIPADAEIARKLHIMEGDPVFQISHLHTADGKPAIYCEDVVAKALVLHSCDLEDLNQLIFTFLQNFCGTSAYLDLTDVHPAAADETLAEILQIPVGTPLLHMDEVDYDIDGNPVFCASEYFVDGIVKHTVLRKKL